MKLVDRSANYSDYDRMRWWAVGPVVLVDERRPWRTTGLQLWWGEHGPLMLRRIDRP